MAGVVSVGLPVGLGPGARAGTPRWRYSLSGARPPGGPARAWCERARAGGAGCDGPLLAKRRCLLPLDSRRSVCPQTRRVPVGLRRAGLSKDVDAPHGVGVGAVPGTRFQPGTGRSIRRWRTDTTTIYRLPCCTARWHHWLGEPRCPETCFLAARPLICAVTQYAGGDRITPIRAWPLGTGPAAEDRPCAVHVRRRGRCQHLPDGADCVRWRHRMLGDAAVVATSVGPKPPGRGAWVAMMRGPPFSPSRCPQGDQFAFESLNGRCAKFGSSDPTISIVVSSSRR